MSKYILVVETGADLPAELAQRYNVFKVPMHVTFGDVTKDDGSFPIRDLYDFYEKTGILPKTSGCAPDDFTVIYDQIHEKYPEAHIIHLAYSAATTCSMQSAIVAAEGRDYCTSIDTKFVSCGQTLVTLHTARYIEANPDCTVDDIVKEVERFRETCRMGFFPGDLVYLKAGGRVSNAAYLGAKILNLHPLIELQDGLLKATKKYRGSIWKIAPRLLDDFTQNYHLSKDILCFVYAEGLPQELMDQVTKKAKDMGFKEIYWCCCGGVVSTHSGPGGYGVSGISLG